MSASRSERRRRQKADWKAAQQRIRGGGCPNGHQEQAAAWMLYGIAPTQCERCGETPVFDPLEQNISPDLPGYVADDDNDELGEFEVAPGVFVSPGFPLLMEDRLNGDMHLHTRPWWE